MLGLRQQVVKLTVYTPFPNIMTKTASNIDGLIPALF